MDGDPRVRKCIEFRIRVVQFAASASIRRVHRSKLLRFESTRATFARVEFLSIFER